MQISELMMSFASQFLTLLYFLYKKIDKIPLFSCENVKNNNTHLLGEDAFVTENAKNAITEFVTLLTS